MSPTPHGKSLIKARRWVFVLLISALSTWANIASAATAKHAFRGVVGVSQPEVGANGQMVIRVREFDSWLIWQMRSKLILGEKYFDGNQFRRWLVLLDNVTSRHPDPDFLNSAAPSDKDHFGQWSNQTLAASDPNVDLLLAYQTLRRDIVDSFYLILGDSRLRHVHPRKPSEFYTRDNVVFCDLVFVLEKFPEDAEEWAKLSRGALHLVPSSVRVGFDAGGSEFTLDTLVPENLQPPDTVVPEDAKSRPGEAAAQAPQAQGFVRSFSFVAYEGWALIGGGVLVVLMFVSLVILGAKTGLVRDPDLPRRDDEKKMGQFNLARCQTAFWFFLVVGAYIFLGVVKGNWDTLITDQCLVLLGISTGTVLGSAYVSRNARTAAPPPPPHYTAGRIACLMWIRRFFAELLSDDSGRITFYRFQLVAWTVVLGMVFIFGVCGSLEMPKFGANELALMGISAGTYLAFKFPEVKTGAAPPDGRKEAGGG